MNNKKNLKEFRNYIKPYLIKYFKEGNYIERREVKELVYKNKFLTLPQKDLVFEEMMREVGV